MFSNVAEKILNKTVLISNDKKYRICEIEFYLYSEDHQDPYVHRAPEQLENKKIYFHRSGTKHDGKYKGGTFKGMDLTLGNGKEYYGVLIRSIMNLENDKFIEGPCNCVNELIERKRVEDYVNEYKISAPPNAYKGDNNIGIVFQDEDLPVEQIYTGRRYGLKDNGTEWFFKSYRFLTMKNKIKKQKSDLVKI